MNDLEKSGWGSKKFRAFFLVEALLFTLALCGLLWQDNLGWPLSAFMVLIAATMGYLAVMYIGKQADLDRYVRLAMLGFNAVDNESKSAGQQDEQE